MAGEVTLVKTWSSAFALRVVWALPLEGVQYESVLEDLSNKSDLLLRYNPVYKKVAVLLHEGRTISESLIILKYIDETWNQYPLLPQDPYARAMVRFWAKFGNNKTMTSIWTAFISEGKLQRQVSTCRSWKNSLKGRNSSAEATSNNWTSHLDGWPIYLGYLRTYPASKWLKEFSDAWSKEFSDAPIIKDCWPPHDKLIPKFIALRQVY